MRASRRQQETLSGDEGCGCEQAPFSAALVRAAFRALDLDGSGLVSAREFRADAAAYSYPKVLADQSVRLGDADGDGSLSLPEFFQTLADPENEEEDNDFWEAWFNLHEEALGGGQLSAEGCLPAGVRARWAELAAAAAEGGRRSNLGSQPEGFGW